MPPSDNLVNGAKVLVIGASYGGLAAALNLLDLCCGKPARFDGESKELAASKRTIIPIQIKVVDERDGYYHLIGSPLALASKDFAAKAWVKYDGLPALRSPAISWMQGSVNHLDCEKKIATITDASTGKKYEENYDYVVASTGLRRAWPTVPQSLTEEDYRSEVNTHIQKVKEAREGVVVVGGGAVGIEMAAELKLLEPSKKVTLIHSREDLLSSEPLPADFKERTLITLRQTGVEVILNDRVTNVTPVDFPDGTHLSKLTLKDGKHMITSHVIWAISRSTPTSSYLPQSALDPNGYINVESTLRFASGNSNSSNHFAVGDIASWTGIRRCGGAMHMGYVAATNIHQDLLSKQTGSVPNYTEIQPFPAMIALAVGSKAVVYSPTEGTKSGEDQMEMFFGKDLGFTSIESPSVPNSGIFLLTGLNSMLELLGTGKGQF